MTGPGYRLDPEFVMPNVAAPPPMPPAQHRPFQVGTHDREGFRTHAIPGDVCLDCSTPSAGQWVPISQCPAALAALDADEAALDADE